MKRTGAREGGGRTRERRYSLLSLAGLAVVMLAVAGCDGGGGGSDSGAGVGISPTAGIFPSDEVLCGAGEDCVITAGQNIPIGTMTVNNDDDYIYIKVELEDGWVIDDVTGGSKVWVGTGDHPDDGRPAAGSFCQDNADWCTDFTEHVATTDYAIQFTDVIAVDGVTYEGCPQELFIYLHLDVVRLDDDGNEIQSETAWAGCIEGTGRGAWYFYSTYTTVCCDDDGGDDGEFRTQTQGGWGTLCHGENPGCYRDEWFEVAFPDGVELGCDSGFTALFTTSEAVQNFLPTGGKSGALTGNLVDPTGNTSAGVLLGQLLAAELSVAFDMVDPDFSESDDLLIDLVLCNTGTAADGLTVGQILDEANLIVGGCTGTTGLSAAAISDALAAINENFVDGDLDLGNLCAP